MPNPPVPALSPDGWVTDTVIKCDYLLSHFFLSEYSSSYVSYGKVTSFPYILQKNKDSKTNLVDDTKSSLLEYFGRYFTKTEVDVKLREEDPSKYGIVISITVTDENGKEFSVAKIADILDAKILSVRDLNNYGTTEP